ncbi:MAG: hypothetical protein FWC97_01130, partial [Treponema sp.]|nr:hypothetical protein [Treponema sp.]
MTQTATKTALKTSLYPLFSRKMDRYLRLRTKNTAKIPPAVTIHGENFCPKQFAWKELDRETGLYYFGARYLDPRTSRWLSVDPAIWQGDFLPSAP